MKYEDYVCLGYSPRKQELITVLRFKAKNPKRAAGALAAESSIGTWQEVKTEKSYVKKLAAKVFFLRKEGKHYITKIAYPIELFEPGNIPNLLSSVAGNIFGMKELQSLRLEDITMPRKFVKSFEGPHYGIEGIRKVMRVKKRPLIGTIIKPKLGLKPKDHARVALEAWLGGCDIVKDDENLASQKFNEFEKRLRITMKAKEKAERETGEKKAYVVNVTAETLEMLERAEKVEKLGNGYCMIDIITCGFSALQSLRKNTRLIIHGHRAMHAALTRNKNQGISMKVIAKLARLAGVDQLHVGAVFGKMHEGKEEVKKNVEALKEDIGLKPTMPIASGGLSPLDVPHLVDFFGPDVIIQMGGGIHAHPQGTFAGARAARQAIEAVMQGEKLESYAKKHEELRQALDFFKK